MTGDTKSRERAARAERLGAALRENLKRRKAQSKVRASQAQPGPVREGCGEAAAEPETYGRDDRGTDGGNH